MGACLGISSPSVKQPLLPNEEIEQTAKDQPQPHGGGGGHENTYEAQTIEAKTGPEERLKELLASLPSKGMIQFEEANNFWSINLGEAWNGNSTASQIVALCKPLLEGHARYEECREKATRWASMLNDEDAAIECVKPPSLSGFHISLARWSKEDAQFPKDKLAEGKEVQFELGNIEIFASDREEPVNLPGQREDDDGLRDYPILWIKTTLNWKDFEFQTRFPPHISLAAFAVRLKVDAVEKYQQNKDDKGPVPDSVLGADALDNQNEKQG